MKRNRLIDCLCDVFREFQDSRSFLRNSMYSKTLIVTENTFSHSTSALFIFLFICIQISCISPFAETLRKILNALPTDFRQNADELNDFWFILVHFCKLYVLHIRQVHLPKHILIAAELVPKQNRNSIVFWLEILALDLVIRHNFKGSQNRNLTKITEKKNINRLVNLSQLTIQWAKRKKNRYFVE